MDYTDLIIYFLSGFCSTIPLFLAYYLARQVKKFFSSAIQIN